MTINDIRSLFAYNDWANDRTLTSIERLGQEPLTRGLNGSFASILDTVTHLVAAEWIWLRRWKGESPRSMPEWGLAPTADLLRAKLREVEMERADFLTSLRDEDLDKPVTYVNMAGETWTYPLGDLLIHFVNHSTYHRGQVATMLRQVGGIPMPTDLLVYKDLMIRA